ncbi:hypothetical protein FRB94_003955 [Tulasnella sp. JGI-2019a]|nr:hypothetical protein FRB94_003955 [Tulasnella sp. JGI-2019a]KAG9008207.1 hypothetical protein FRB93_006775 [Tulasnella sp. JGI-2019a]
MASLKFEIETWAAALEAYDAQDLDLSLDLFSKIADNSKIFTNIGIIHASLGEHEAAVEAFRAATSLDSYLAIAYFQAGVSNFLLGQFDVAFKDFEDAFQVLRGNEAINYEQLGLKYQLHAAAVLFNQGITMINLCDVDRGMQILREAQALKAQDDHDVIADAIQDRGEGYSVFCIPMGVLYRPNEKKVANMRARDWMGKARLISATNSKDELEAFAGPKRAAPPRPDPPPPQAGLGRSRSAVAPSTVRFADAPRIVRSATTAGNTTLPPRDLMDSLTVTKRPVVVSPLDTSFDSLQSQPPAPSVPLPLPPPEPLRVLTKSKSLTFRSNEGGMRGPPMARRPTLKVQNVDPIEFPPSPPTSQRSDSVSSETSTKGQRLLDAVEEEERQDRYGKPILPPPANVPEDVETLSMMGDVYDGYLNSGDEDYFGMDKAMSRMGTKSLRRQDSLGNPKVPLPSTIAALPATPKVVVTRPTRSNTLPSPRGSPTMGLGLMNSALDSSASSVSGSSVAFGEDLELQRIRVKLHHRDDIRAMLVAPVISFAELRKRVCDKFEQPLSGMRLKFDDEDGTRMSIRDEEDWEIAIGTARNHMKALGGGLGEGKLTIWCEEE